MGQEKNAENIPFLRSTQPKSTERVPVVELSGYNVYRTRSEIGLRFLRDLVHQLALY